MSESFTIDKHFLFPTVVFSSEDFLKKEECEAICHFLKNNINATTHSYISGEGSGSSFTESESVINVLEDNSIVRDLSLRINLALKAYFDHLEVSQNIKFKITNSWYNVNKKGSNLSYHNHPRSILAGAVYLKAESNSSQLCFRSSDDVGNFLIDNKEVSFEVSSGKLILFPGWIYHGFANPNLSEERIVLSFNVWIDIL